jgi:hypothetical protein
MKQSRRMSLVEAIANVAVGYQQANSARRQLEPGGRSPEIRLRI